MHTISGALQHSVSASFYSVDGLVIEHNHFSSNSYGRACQRKQSDVNVLLPKVTDEVNRLHNC